MATTENGQKEEKPMNNENAAQESTNGEKNGDVTVFHNPDNFNVKHPLMHEWTLWFTKPPSKKVCLRNLLFIYSFNKH